MICGFLQHFITIIIINEHNASASSPQTLIYICCLLPQALSDFSEASLQMNLLIRNQPRQRLEFSEVHVTGSSRVTAAHGNFSQEHATPERNCFVIIDDCFSVTFSFLCTCNSPTHQDDDLSFQNPQEPLVKIQGRLSTAS